jgi:hypothetical protein
MGKEEVAAQDEQYLQLLTILHYVLAAVVTLIGCFPLLHVAMGIMFLVMPMPTEDGNPGGPPPALLGILFIVFPGMIILAFWAIAACIFFGGRCLARRVRYTFCLVAAGISCLIMPIGTALGVFTMIVLLRPSVKLLFESQEGGQTVPLP